MTGSISTQLTADSSPVSQSLVTLIATLSDAVPSLSSAIGVPNNALQNEFDSMKIIYDNASENLSRAEKNFIISKGGIEDYNKLTDGRISTELDEISNMLIDDYRNNMTFIDQIAIQFKSEISSLRNAKMGYDNLLIENAILTKKLDAYSRILNTNERKTVYELRNMKNLYTYRRVLFFVYYLAIIAYIFFSDFIPKKLYADYTYIVIILIVIIFPFMLNTLISWTVMFINAIHYWLDDSMVKDVYDELDKTT